MKLIDQTYLQFVVRNFAFLDYISSLVRFCKNQRFEKISLPAVDLLRKSFVFLSSQDLQADAHELKIIEDVENNLEEKWLPLLFGLSDVVMTCELEVRTR